jgi:hypothetical protein
MPVSITVDDELAQRLEQQAHARRVSLQQWALQVLRRAPDFPDQAEGWRELNARRFQLISQRHRGGLTAAEEAELAELQTVADRWLEPSDRQRLEMLKPYEELALQLTRQSDG